MAGVVEAGTVVGLITGVISTIEATKTVYDTAKDVKSQLEAFRQMAARLPLVCKFLHRAKERIVTLGESAPEALKPILKSCKGKASNLENLFRRVVRKDDDKWHNRDKKPSGTLGKVVCLMEVIFIQVLVCERLMGIATDAQMEEIKEAIKQMREMASSPLDKARDTEDFNQPSLEKFALSHRLPNYVRSVAFSTDGTWLALACRDKTVRLWNTTTWKWQPLIGHTKTVTSIAFSTDGILASASWDKTVRLWDATTGKCLQTLVGHTDSVTSVAFSTDGTWLASASHDETRLGARWTSLHRLTARASTQRSTRQTGKRLSLQHNGNPDVLSLIKKYWKI
jgi:hypothetical protein